MRSIIAELPEIEEIRINGSILPDQRDCGRR